MSRSASGSQENPGSLGVRSPKSGHVDGVVEAPNRTSKLPSAAGTSRMRSLGGLTSAEPIITTGRLFLAQGPSLEGAGVFCPKRWEHGRGSSEGYTIRRDHSSCPHVWAEGSGTTQAGSPTAPPRKAQNGLGARLRGRVRTPYSLVSKAGGAHEHQTQRKA